MGFWSFVSVFSSFFKFEGKEVNSRNVSSGKPLFLSSCITGWGGHEAELWGQPQMAIFF